jgi:hypothetical protein
MILSVFFVCFFSVLLYDREKPRSAVESVKGERKREAPSKPEPPVAPVQPASSEKPSTIPAAPAPEGSSPKAPEPASPANSATPETAKVASELAAERQKAAPSPLPSTPPEPRGAFTTAKDGESLDDIAVRVYGSADQADSLWRANRDQLPHRNSPIKAGAVLRTPAE